MRMRGGGVRSGTVRGDIFPTFCVLLCLDLQQSLHIICSNIESMEWRVSAKFRDALPVG